MLVSSYEVDDILFCESLFIFDAISDYGAQSFVLHSSSASLPLITWSSPHRTSKEEDILHPPEHLLLTLGADFTTHGLLFKATTYQFLECSTHGSNPQEPLLSLQMISATLHGSSFHHAAIYISDSVECIVILPKWKIPPEIFFYFGFIGSHAQSRDATA